MNDIKNRIVLLNVWSVMFMLRVVDYVEDEIHLD